MSRNVDIDYTFNLPGVLKDFFKKHDYNFDGSIKSHLKFLKYRFFKIKIMRS